MSTQEKLDGIDGESGELLVRMTHDAMRACSGQGSMDDNVRAYVDDAAHVEWIADADTLRDSLAREGAWTREELATASEDALRERTLWVCACNLREEEREDTLPKMSERKSLIGAKYGVREPIATWDRKSEGYALPVWDEGYGSVWIYREPLGPVGIVRATTLEEAWDCVVDEIMLDADPEDTAENTDADGNLPEGCYYRSSGTPANGNKWPNRATAIAQEDLNGSRLDLLTVELAEELGIVLETRDD